MRRWFRIALDVDFLHDAGNRLVLRRTGPRGQPLRIAGVNRELGLRHGGLQNLLGAGRRDELQVVHGHFGCQLGSRFLDHLIDQVFDFRVIFRRGPSDHLAGTGTGHEAGLWERGG